MLLPAPRNGSPSADGRGRVGKGGHGETQLENRG